MSKRLLRRKATRRRVVRYSIIGLNTIVVIAVLAFVLTPSASSSSDTKSSIAVSPDDGVSASPLDTLSSSEIAATTAQLASLPETTALVNQADSDQAELHMVASDNNLITKPQVVASDYLSNKDVKTYVVKKGDTLASVAEKFNLSPDTIKWSNHITSLDLTVGTKLLIPPVDGLVYKVEKGDTPASLASKFDADESKIIAYNDAELGGLKVGERILIPGGSKQAPVTSSYSYSYLPSGNAAWGSAPIYGSNGYDYGWCTWYVASKISVPANWGNANTWAYYASQTPGWTVSSVPTVGSIAQNSTWFGGVGHVGIVTGVKGSQIQLTDMADPAWGVVSTHWVSASEFPSYIRR